MNKNDTLKENMISDDFLDQITGGYATENTNQSSNDNKTSGLRSSIGNAMGILRDIYNSGNSENNN